MEILSLLGVEDAPAAAPPPPDPAAMAMAAAATENMQKGQEKTDKKISEEGRKHAKREEWRARQAAKLVKITANADKQIASEVSLWHHE